MLEELNRAERYIQQPALQLLTARRLHEYELPPGWVCFADDQPGDGRLPGDPARPGAARALPPGLRCAPIARRGSPGRRRTACTRASSRSRTRTSASSTTCRRARGRTPPSCCRRFTPAELEDGALLRDALGGYLPPAWVEALLAVEGHVGRASSSFDVRALLADYAPGSPLAKEIAGYRAARADRSPRRDRAAPRAAPRRARRRACSSRRGSSRSRRSRRCSPICPAISARSCRRRSAATPRRRTLVDVDPDRAARELRGQRRGEEDPRVARRSDEAAPRRARGDRRCARTSSSRAPRRAEAEQRGAHVPRAAARRSSASACDAARRDAEARRHHAGAAGRMSARAAPMTRASSRPGSTASSRDPAFLERYPYYAAVLAQLTPVADPSVARMAVSLHDGRFYLHVNVESFVARAAVPARRAAARGAPRRARPPRASEVRRVRGAGADGPRASRCRPTSTSRSRCPAR